MKKIPVYWFVVIALLPVMLLRDFTPDNELRYLSIADEALRDGTFFTFNNHGVPYADKPPLYFWIIMLGKGLFGQHYMWFLSLFSLLPALVITETMDRWTRPLMDEGQRLTAKWMLLSCGLFAGMCVVLRMDMLMCMFITLSLYSFHRMEEDGENYGIHSLLFPIYVFLALFSKGPVGILIPLLSIVAWLLWCGQPRRILRYWGWRTWAMLLTGCILWFGAVYAEAGEEYLYNLLFHQTIDRAIDSFHHEEPFYYYLIAVWYAYAPWSLLIVPLLVIGFRRKLFIYPMQRFFLLTAGVTLLMLSCISSKIAVYLLPTYPFVVYAAVSILPQVAWQKRLTAVVRNTAMGIFCIVFVGGWALPWFNDRVGYGELCREVDRIGHEEQLANYYVWKIRRPENMDVYLTQDVRVVSTEELASGIPGGVLMFPKKVMDQLPANIPTARAQYVGPYVIIPMR